MENLEQKSKKLLSQSITVDVIHVLFIFVCLYIAGMSSYELRVFPISFTVLATCVGLTRLVSKLILPADYEKELKRMERRSKELANSDVDAEIQASKSISRSIKRAVYILAPVFIFGILATFFAIMMLALYFVQVGGM